MRRESHQYRGIRRPTRGAGWGHRAVYVGAAIATAALVTGFGLAGFYFGSFSHVWNQSSAQGNENAAYGVVFLTEGATYASLVTYLNLGAAPCSTLPTNGTNVSDPAAALNLSASNATDSLNANATFVCLNSVSNSTVSYAWGAYTNQTAWNVINVSAANVSGAPVFNESYENLTGYNGSVGNLVETGCNPYFNATAQTNASIWANCPFFAGNTQTAFMPHGGFWTGPNDTGTWISETNSSSPDPWYWHPGQAGYLPTDQVYYASIGFLGQIPGLTYEVVVSIGGVTPVPEVYYVNTGSGANETLTFVFDMTAAWTSAGDEMQYGALNATEGYYGGFQALVGTVSITVSQCYVDAQGHLACPNSLGGTTQP